jgi:hypothetical protein
MSRRLEELARSLYASDPAAFAALIAQYGIDYVIVGRDREADLTSLRIVAASFAPVQSVVDALEHGQTPFYVALIDSCARDHDAYFVLLDAACLAGAS